MTLQIAIFIDFKSSSCNASNLSLVTAFVWTKSLENIDLEAMSHEFGRLWVMVKREKSKWSARYIIINTGCQFLVNIY